MIKANLDNLRDAVKALDNAQKLIEYADMLIYESGIETDEVYASGEDYIDLRMRIKKYLTETEATQ